MASAFFTPGSPEAFHALQMNRFERSCMVVMQQGDAAAKVSAVGRRVLGHVIEAQRAAAEAAALQRHLAGRQCAATLEWQHRRQQEQEAAERVKAPMRQLSEWATSEANPLNTKADAAAAASAAAAAAAATAAAAAASGSGGSCSGVCWVAAAFDGSAEAAAVSRGVRTFHHVADHLQTGSLAPAEPETAADALFAARCLAAQADIVRLNEHNAMLAALAVEYPHGIPKKVLHDLQARGVNDAPALGFGLRASSTRLDTIIIKDP